MESSIDKTALNIWISELDNIHQLKALRSTIASAPNRDALWNELSQEAQENLHSDDDVEKTDLQFTPARFWRLVWSLKESSKPWSWDDISEAEREGIKRGRKDVKAGRTISHEEFMNKHEHRLKGNLFN